MNPNADEESIDKVFENDTLEDLVADEEVSDRYQHLVDQLVEKAQEVWPPKSKGIIQLSQDWILELWDYMKLEDLPAPKKQAVTRGTHTKQIPQTPIPEAAILVSGSHCSARISFFQKDKETLDVQLSLQDDKKQKIEPIKVTVIKEQNHVIFDAVEHPEHQVMLNGLERTNYEITLSDTADKRYVSVPLTLRIS